MYLLTGILLLIATFVCFKICQPFNKHGKRVAPGPSWALPLLGHLLLLGTKPHLTFKRWRSRYGPIVSWKMGPKNAILLCEAKLIKEMFSKEVAAGRDYSPIFDSMTGRTGVVFGDGRGPSEQRSFAMRTFKELGIGSKGGTLENILLEEGLRLATYLEGRAGSRVEVTGLFNGAVLNNMWTIISGEKHDWTVNPELEHVKVFENFSRAGNMVAETGLLIAPWLRHVIPSWSGWTEFVKANEEFGRMVDNAVTKRLASKNTESSASDFIGQYLLHMEGVSDPESSFYKETGRKNLKGTVFDLVGAGAETTGGALEFAVLYLAHSPGVQAQLQQELDAVLGSHHHLPSLLDKLPYLEAVVWEVLRLASHVPFGLPHRLMESIVDFHGISIPKDTIIFPDVYNVNHDPDTWTLPKEFNPSRFLNERGELRGTDSVISFSVGRRRCAGESLAKSILFLFLAVIFQRFGVEPAESKENWVEDVVCGVSLKPKPFQVVFKLRTSK